jgi:hypothetical protein
MLRTLTIALFVSLFYSGFSQRTSFSGYVRDKESLESIPYAGILVLPDSNFTVTNEYGFFKVDSDRADLYNAIQIVTNYLGYNQLTYVVSEKDVQNQIILLLEKSSIELDEVVIRERFNSLSIHQINKESISGEIVRKMPAFAGEADILKTIQLLPGVLRGFEGTNSYFVRGGGADQNLVLLDGATVYNANHIFGFVSVFNQSTINNADFWRTSIPARFGGRASSVLDIQLKEGNMKEFDAQAGIGLLSSNIMLEGPIVKERVSYMLSGRRSYLDLLLRPFMEDLNSMQLYSFYDFNMKLNAIVNSKNRIFLSTYSGSDQLISEDIRKSRDYRLENNTGLGWGNRTFALRWNQVIGERLFWTHSVTRSTYNFGYSDEFLRIGVDPFEQRLEINSDLQEHSFTSNLDLFLPNNHFLKIGVQFKNQMLDPRAVSSLNADAENPVIERDLSQQNEYSVYLDDEKQINKTFTLSSGLRFTGLLTEGRDYFNIEPRISLMAILSEDIKLSASFTRANQYIHLLSNTGLGLSTDLWVPVTDELPPQSADHWSVELTKHYPSLLLDVSLSGYFKKMRNLISYKENGAFLVISDGVNAINWEDNVANGNGKSMGYELFLRKDVGRFSGWANYTLSWTVHQFDELNNGRPFYPVFDRRHSISLLGAYSISDRCKFSFSWYFASGNHITVPQGQYYDFIHSGLSRAGGRPLEEVNLSRFFGPDRTTQLPINQETIYYTGSKGWFKAEAYHRLDISFQLHKSRKRFKRYWELGLYNAYFRQNPFSYSVENSGGEFNVKRESLFPILPSISYNISLL